MTDALEDAQASPAGTATGKWRDPDVATADRVADLVGRMTLEEKVHQLVGFWAAPAQAGEPVAPMEDEFHGSTPPLDQVVPHGLGQLTRVFGTEPVSPQDGRARLLALQRQIANSNRFGIPAVAHEECLTGVTAYTATVFPIPLAWGASFNPELVESVAGAIASSLRRMGIHQGLAPVLDVTRDYRWGRTEETIGEDPYLVATIGTAYVRGLEQSGVIATLKHFAGYSTSQAGRNLAPAALGPREFSDVIVEPFVTALREGGARSVMHSYADVDGVPPAADERLLSDLLRDELGFTGTVVADYFGVSFLEVLHGVASDPGEAAGLALHAGVDVELPTVRCYGQPLIDRVRAGTVPEEWVDRSVSRVLAQKCELRMLDDSPQAGSPDLEATANDLPHLDPAEHRQLARQLAQESIVLLANDELLPLAPGTGRNNTGESDNSNHIGDVADIAVVGPLADDPECMLGCYSFPRHVGAKHPELPLGVEIPTLAGALRAEFPRAVLTIAPGCAVDSSIGQDAAGAADGAANSSGASKGDAAAGDEDGDIANAVAAAQAAGLCVLALGDRAGMFGDGTSGEGCDRTTLELPGRQAELAAAVLATGTPTVLVTLSGRPYALGGLADRSSAALQAFFPGEEGATAIAGVISGRVAPSGRLPVGIPQTAGGQPGTYLHSKLGGRSDVSAVDPTPLYPFGHGLTWTRFAYSDLTVLSPDGDSAQVPTDGQVRVAATVTNAGDCHGTEVVQLYLADPVASVVRPVQQLVGWERVTLGPGESAHVEFTVHADRTSFTGRNLRRIVEPGRIDVMVGASSADLRLHGSFELRGPQRELGQDRVLTVPSSVTAL